MCTRLVALNSSYPPSESICVRSSASLLTDRGYPGSAHMPRRALVQALNCPKRMYLSPWAFRK
jgi:hypothetical protein